MDVIEIQARRIRAVVSLAINPTNRLIYSIIGNEEEADGRLWLIRLQLLILEKRLRGERLAPTRINGYLGVTIPNMNSKQFRQHFRMMPSQLEPRLITPAPALHLPPAKCTNKQSQFPAKSFRVRLHLARRGG